MIEFKFPCPRCGQHILGSDAYSGQQIGCPTCHSPIIVPHLPGVSAASGAEPAAIPQSRKAGAKWIVACTAIGLVLVAAMALMIFSGRASRRLAAKYASGGTNPQSPSAAEIVQKVAEQYESFTNYSAKGSVVSVVDMSKVDLKNMPGVDKTGAGGISSKIAKLALLKPVQSESEFSLRLARPGFYRIEWEGKMGPAPVKGAAWSIGEGDFLSVTKAKYTKMPNREAALSTAAGFSGGVAATLPNVFFTVPSGLLAAFKKAQRADDEIVDDDECYVLKSDILGMKTVLWVTKSGFLIKQKQLIMGGKTTMPAVNEAELDDQFKKINYLTAEQKAQAKALAKNMKPMISQTRGSTTETYRDIQFNQPVKKEDFNCPLPAGAALSASLF